MKLISFAIMGMFAALTVTTTALAEPYQKERAVAGAHPVAYRDNDRRYRNDRHYRNDRYHHDQRRSKWHRRDR